VKGMLKRVMCGELFESEVGMEHHVEDRRGRREEGRERRGRREETKKRG
jgi:hypothetical protein